MNPEWIVNFLIIIAILVIVIIIAYRLSKRNFSIPEEVIVNTFSIEYLTGEIKRILDDIQNENINDLNLNKKETEKRESNKSQVRKALRDCSTGDGGAKKVVLYYIKRILEDRLSVNEETINQIIPFDTKDLSAGDKFEILIQKYKSTTKNNADALTKLIIAHNLADEKKFDVEEYYEITASDIDKVYGKESPALSYRDKLEVVAQRIYQIFKGHGAADILRDMNIDGIHGGLSGLAHEFYSDDIEWLDTVKKEHLNSYDSIWIFFKGKTFRLSFLGHGSNKELIRVCKNIYQYGNPGQFPETKGYILNTTKDGARVTVFRPAYSAGWAYIVRKYDTIPKKSMDAVITDKGHEIVKKSLNFMVKGKFTLVISGEKGCGKTTLLMAMIDLLKKTSRIRSFEKIFELYINKHFLKMNVLSLRKTDTIKGQDALDSLLTSDGNITILGEVGTYEEANMLMSIKEKNSDTTLATIHTDTADDLVSYVKKSFLLVGGYNDVVIAERDAVRLLNFDIHMVNINGHRHIERITEIFPKEINRELYNTSDFIKEVCRKLIDPKTYETKDIIVFENGKYVIKNGFSKRATEKILNNLNDAEKIEFEELFGTEVNCL